MARLTFQNDTDRTWTMCVYQQNPQSRKLDTVAWLVATAAPGQRSSVTWTESVYGVVLGEFGRTAKRQLYVPLDSRDTERGACWKIVSEHGRQRLEPAGPSPLRDQIVFTNESGYAANPGITVSGSAVAFKRDLPSGAAAQFIIRPIYYAGLFASIRVGEVVGRAVIGPLALQPARGVSDATLIARVEGRNMWLELRPGKMELVSLAEIAHRLEREGNG